MSQVIRASAGFSDQSGQAYQQHLVYCSNSRKWLLADVASGSTGSMNFYYNASEDFVGGSWVQCASSPYTMANAHAGGGANLSAYYKSINSVDVVRLVHGRLNAGNPYYDIIRLTFNGDINVSNDGAAGSEGTPTNAPYGLNVAIDSDNKWYEVESNGTGAGLEQGVYSNFWGSADTGTSWSVLGEVGQTFGVHTNEPNGIILLPMTGSIMLVLFEGSSDAEPNSMKSVFHAKSTSGSGFGADSDVGFTTLGSGVDPNNFGAVNCGGSDVHCVLRTGSNTYSHRRFDGANWNSTSTNPPNQNSKAGAGLFMASDGTNVWLFVIDSDGANTVRFVKWTGATATWDAAWTAIETSSKTRNYISGCRDVSPSGYIGVIWTETNGATFDLVGTSVRVQPMPFTDFQVPKGRIGVVSLRTHAQSTPLNLIGKDTMFGAAGEPRVETNQPPPPRGRPFAPSNRGFVQGASALLLTPPNFPCGQIRQTEWPVPRGRPYPISLRTHVEPLKQLLLHQDQFFGAPGQPPANHDFPVPKGRTPPIVNRTHVQGVRLNLIGQDTFYSAAGQPPANQDFPNPRGRAAAIALRTFIQQTPLNLVGKDTFFGLAGQPPENHDFPVPRGRTPAISLRTHVQPMPLNLLGQDTFYAGAGIGPKYDWPNPRGRTFPISLRTHTQELKQNLLGQDAFGPAPITRSWVPSDLGSPLVAWYKADALSLNDGDAVASWTDSSGNGRAATQGTVGQRPLYKANIQAGLPVVRSDGIDDQLRTASFTYNQPTTIFVAASTAHNTFGYLFSSLSNFGNALFRGDGGGGAYNWTMYSGNALGGPPVLSAGSFHILSLTYNSASSAFRVDGGTALTGDVSTQNGDGLVLFNRYDSALPTDDDLGEILVCAGALSTADRQLVEGYLAWKWNLVGNLPSDHPYKNAAPIITLSAASMLFVDRPGTRDFPNPRGRRPATSLLSLQVGYNPSLYPPIAFPSVVVMAQGWYAPQIVMGYQLPTAQGAYNQEIVSGFFPEDGT